MGTSAGALAGSLFAAGYSAARVARELSLSRPADLLSVSAQPWKGGLLSMDPVIRRLSQLLPATFEELPTEFAVGVVTRDGRHALINRGPLPEAVVASAAIPWLFSGVDIPGRESLGPFRDGGCVDRIGLRVSRRTFPLLKEGCSCLCHKPLLPSSCVLRS